MAELPTGAVTFLFTDIEGSTRLVKQLREGWGDVIAEHQRLPRGAFSHHNGRTIRSPPKSARACATFEWR